MTLDIIFVLFAAIGFYTGYARGIIKTVFTILSFTIGLLAAFKMAPAFTNFLEDLTKNDNPLMFIAGFLLSFIIMMVILRLISRGLEGILKSANINFINQIIGGVVLGAGSILIYSTLVWFADKSHMIDSQTKQSSLTYAYTKEFPSQMKVVGEQLKPVFTDFWNEALDFMDRMEDMSVQRSESDPTIYDIEEDEGN
ncbi:MAG: CvpA family protein [Bacteroidota bacterium]